MDFTIDTSSYTLKPQSVLVVSNRSQLPLYKLQAAIFHIPQAPQDHLHPNSPNIHCMGGQSH